MERLCEGGGSEGGCGGAPGASKGGVVRVCGVGGAKPLPPYYLILVHFVGPSYKTTPIYIGIKGG
jgi:hypothetical protein